MDSDALFAARDRGPLNSNEPAESRRARVENRGQEVRAEPSLEFRQGRGQWFEYALDQLFFEPARDQDHFF